jgi:hypothetical protein
LEFLHYLPRPFEVAGAAYAYGDFHFIYPPYLLYS